MIVELSTWAKIVAATASTFRAVIAYLSYRRQGRGSRQDEAADPDKTAT